MGQRLNIEISYNGTPIANCYYHWSAYTRSAAALVNTILEYYSEESLPMGTDDELLISAIKMFEQTNSIDFSTGKITYAALNVNDYEIIHSKFPGLDFNTEIDRNAGIIGFTEKEMKKTRDVEEGYVMIDFGSKTILFDVLSFYDINEFLQEKECLADDNSEFDNAINDIIIAPLLKTTSEFTFDDFYAFCSLLQDGYDIFITPSRCDQDYLAITIE